MASLRSSSSGRFPPVPSLTPIYMSTQTDTANSSSVSWSGVDIGVPHPKRIVILAGFFAVEDVTASATLNGMTPQGTAFKTTNASCAIFSFQVPTGLTADFTWTAAGSPRKAISVYVAYPHTPFMLSSSAAGSGDNGFPMNITTLDTQAGGFVISAVGARTDLITFTPNWTGTETHVEDVDAQIEATSSYAMGHINILTSSSGLTLQWTGSVDALKRGAAASFGPAYG